MPRYFFHLTTPNGTDLDDTGIEWPDPNFAYLEACKAIPNTVLEIIKDGGDPANFAFEIVDQTGNVLWHIPLLERVAQQRLRHG